MTNEEHIAKFEQGMGAWNQWRAEQLDELDFSAVNFTDENLNLFAAVPDGVDLSAVAYSTLGAIAMQGRRVVGGSRHMTVNQNKGQGPAIRATIEAYCANDDSPSPQHDV